MFELSKDRFTTQSIVKVISKEHQKILWEVLDKMIAKGLILDHLQVFEFRVENYKQVLVNRQEQPERKIKMKINQPKNLPLIHETIWIIDNGECVVMLLPRDY